MSKVMAVNAGSSSLKYKLYEMPEETVICSGIVERIGFEDAIFTLKKGDTKKSYVTPIKDHQVAINLLLEEMIKMHVVKHIDEIVAVGHRVVQGGKYFSKTTEIDDEVISIVEKLIPLGPLHNPASIIGIKAFKEVLPNVKMAITCDTSFHQTIEPVDYLYPIPYEFYEKYDLRRYGAHGTSHRYLAERASAMLSKEKLNLITCHLGSGSSITAIQNGRSIATSMGLTPLGGIMMGTRSGDIDPSVYYYIQKVTGKTNDEVFRLLNKESGLKGVSGVSSDSRDILKAMDEGDERAKLTMDLFARRTLDFIGQYFVRLGHVDMIIFSAGIGENDPYIRKVVCDALKPSLGIEIDDELNANARGKEIIISKPSSKIKVAVIPTDEEIMIARDTYKIYLGEKL